MAITTITTTTIRTIAITTIVLTLACYVTSAPTPAPETAAAPAPETAAAPAPETAAAPAPETAAAPAPETAAAPAPESNGCFMALTNLSDCLTYVEDGSKLSKPDKGCCPELAGLVDSNPICLCELLGKPDSIGIKIDLKKSLKLPSVCGVTTPPVSTCSAVGVPVSLPPSTIEGSISPSLAPGAFSPSNAGTASSPGGLGPSSGEAAASPSENKNGVSSIQASAFISFIFGLSTLFVSVFF